MYYKFDNFGRYDGESDVATARSTTVEPAVKSPTYNWNGVDWVHAPDVQVAPITVSVQSSTAASATIRTLTKLEYMDRFTDSELAGIYTAAKTVIQVEIWLEKFKLASSIDLDDPRTLSGLQAMEAAGLLDQGRAAEIAA